nr:unnamed protein product [Callosobruchus analis]
MSSIRKQNCRKPWRSKRTI